MLKYESTDDCIFKCHINLPFYMYIILINYINMHYMKNIQKQIGGLMGTLKQCVKVVIIKGMNARLITDAFFFFLF